MQTQYTNPAIQQAFHTLQQLSADEETRQRAEIRERALKDEASFLWEAREEGLKQGLEQGREQGREQGLMEGVLMGISAVLDVKFGAEGLELLSTIRTISSLERLQQLSEIIRKASGLSAVKEFLSGD